MGKVRVSAYGLSGQPRLYDFDPDATPGAVVGTNLTLGAAVTLLSGVTLPAGYVLQASDVLNGLINTGSGVENGGNGLFEPVITAGTTAQFWRGDKTFTNDLLGPLITYAYQFTKRPSNPAAVPTQALYQDDGSSYKDGTLVWDNYFACTSTMLVGSKGNEQDGIRINSAQTPVRIKASTFGGSASILVHQHSTTAHGELYLSRSNGNSSAHVAVTNGMTLGSVTGLGHTGVSGTGYLPGGDVVFEVDSTGTVSGTSMPGRMRLRVTPDGSATPADWVVATNDRKADFAVTPSVAGTDLALITQTITNGDTTHSPSGDAVFDALALKQPLDATLTALASNDWAANAMPVGTGADTVTQLALAANTFPARSSAGNVAAKVCTDFGLSLVDDADASAARTTLGLGTIATQNANAVAITGGTVNGTTVGATTAATVRGTTVEATSALFAAQGIPLRLAGNTANQEEVVSSAVGVLDAGSRGAIRLWTDVNNNDATTATIFSLTVGANIAGAGTTLLTVRKDGTWGINTTSYGSGVGVIAIANATTVPSTNPTGGGVLYVEGGALKYRGSSGTVTTIAPA